MATPVILPKQGNTVETCLILQWKKRIGDQVKKGEVICEVETDKALFEIESPSDGTLLTTFFNEGDYAPVLTNIAVVGDAGESYEELGSNSAKSETTEKKGERTGEKAGPDSTTSLNEREKKGELPLGEPGPAKRGISPRAKKLADKFGLSIDRIKGTGPNDRIIERDVLAATRNVEPLTSSARDLINKGDARPAIGSGIGNRVSTQDVKAYRQASASGQESIKVVPLMGIRKIIADRMLDSLRNSAQLTLNSSAEATALLSLRKRFKSSSAFEKFQSVTINDLIHFAVIRTLPGHPELNSLLLGDRIEYHDRIHLGFAVDTPRGLMVPVIKNSRSLRLIELSNEAKRLTAASISGKIATEELNGATFTVTNLGSLGIESFTPVLNLPQTAILGVNTIMTKPIDRGKGIEMVQHISFSLTLDHRAIDGAVGARFLQGLAAVVSEIDLAITSDIMGN